MHVLFAQGRLEQRQDLFVNFVDRLGLIACTCHGLCCQCLGARVLLYIEDVVVEAGCWLGSLGAPTFSLVHPGVF